MAQWLETVARRCRGGETLDSLLKDTYIIWEDSIVDENGYAFVVGQLNDTYFYVRWHYAPYSEGDTITTPRIVILKNSSEVKQWLKEIRDSGYEKSTELLNVMKFFLT